VVDGRAAAGGGARRVRATGHPGQQRRGAARPDDLLHVGRGVGYGPSGPPARALRDEPTRHRVLARAEQAGGRPGVRPDREHLVRGVPARLDGSAQLRRGQGRHRRPHGRDGPRLRPLRGAGQRDLPAGPDRDDGRPDGAAACGRRGRPAGARARRAAGGLPGQPGRRGHQRRGVRGTRRGGRRAGSAAGPGGIPFRCRGRHVDAGVGRPGAGRAVVRGGFMSEDTLALAAETIGFPARDSTT
jgi:hypothetical protein